MGESTFLVFNVCNVYEFDNFSLWRVSTSFDESFQFDIFFQTSTPSDQGNKNKSNFTRQNITVTRQNTTVTHQNTTVTSPPSKLLQSEVTENSYHDGNYYFEVVTQTRLKYFNCISMRQKWLSNYLKVIIPDKIR
jgi:hypothetical protein